MEPTQATPAPAAKKPLSQLQIGLITGSVGLLVAGAVILGPGLRRGSRDAEYSAATESNVRTLADAATRYRNEHDGECPEVADLRRLNLVSGLTQNEDAWGNPFAIDCLPTATTALSKGPDVNRGVDDIKKTVAYEPPPPPKSREQLAGEAVAAQTSIAGVWPYVKEYIKDGFAIDGGKATLLTWGTHRMSWSDLQRLPETSVGKVRKDVDAERGKRLCRSGNVIEIEKVDAKYGKYFVGGLLSGSGEIVRFYALRSTGDLVQSSYGRFCGLVTGTDDYENSAGGMSHGVVAIGMFDLPENRK